MMSSPGRPFLSCLLVLPLMLAACESGTYTDRAASGISVRDSALSEETAPRGAIAVTIDDLPWAGATAPGESRLEATHRLLEKLAANDVAATGFVNCGRTSPDDPVLKAWLEAGMKLGNHTDDHLSLNTAETADWIAGARNCQDVLRELTGGAVVPFRYPFLQRGQTPESYGAARSALDSLDAPVAPVTIDTSDWILATAYIDALRSGDEERRRAVGDALVEHVARQAAHYREVARERVGRDVAHVLLLHANAVEADYLDAVLQRLRTDGYDFISLESAMKDPVYRLKDDYLGPAGRSWLYRIEPAMPELAEWDDAEADRLKRLSPR
jgi:peptidoglycan/xylan/chitin deacetylase (PgdA/CDA1 family)